MVRQSKSASASTPASTAAPAVTVVVESVPAPAPATEKKVKKTKAPAVEVAAPASTPAPAPEVAAPEVAAPALPSEVPVDVATLSSKLGDFSSKIQQVAALLTSMKSDYKVLERTVARELKQATKSKGKSRKTSANKNPSGFVKPTKISDELIKFLGKEANTEMSRVEVSKEINAYINEHKLKDEKCGRQINPDAKLTKLLKINKDEVLTFFNLQRYLKIHFIKAPVVA
jgi:chromatin remodeling complex protein RSC6